METVANGHLDSGCDGPSCLNLQMTLSGRSIPRLLAIGIVLLTSFAKAQSPYQASPAFEDLTFTQPVDIVFAPGDSNRSFVIEREGRVTLIRAIGPTLAEPPINLPYTLGDLKITVLNHTGIEAATNDDWSLAENASIVQQTAQRVGAFTIDLASKDAALVVNLEPGIYSAVTEGTDAAGVALVEFYDADESKGPGLLTNSALTRSRRHRGWRYDWRLGNQRRNPTPGARSSCRPDLGRPRRRRSIGSACAHRPSRWSAGLHQHGLEQRE